MKTCIRGSHLCRLVPICTTATPSFADLLGSMIHVCSLARLHATVEDTGARHIISLLADEEHVADLIGFVQRWNRRAPLVVHCYAGISRSTASAFTTVCALNPHRDERSIAQAMR